MPGHTSRDPQSLHASVELTNHRECCPNSVHVCIPTAQAFPLYMVCGSFPWECVFVSKVCSSSVGARGRGWWPQGHITKVA